MHQNTSLRLSGGTKRAIAYLIAVLLMVILAANIGVGLHYYDVLPRYPEPQAGRIYRRMVAFGARVYVDKKERKIIDSLKWALFYGFGSGMCLLFYLRNYRNWF